ncbi:MAG: hypothetical protein D6691_00080 [Candidatus Hydrogenedentota bacterium]|jgi:hypothetical protein|uniref:Deoxyhypusine synthase n=1 Tax=Sumerlaea chitinivorans TaxID=2250252 RepID=A0A2Z4Y429_SUMC1|nr:hypothetical protein BRCON_0496 [Candidatus Sumerlaea chitinivorans]MCX7963456.1 hypothetical protein [Candidatus Sumerlaea chitinivorans]RMH31219.1 MAG: hypothetical protein D6691_00080 [Candidatus Hydrogenedentota bacterium]GIX45391.1 MAG: hypothetical protein KatS3mg130_1799 [Candidatus Sumerlaea sp.]
MTERLKPVDLTKIKTYSVADRPTKVDFSLLAKVPNIHRPLSDFFDTLPNLLKARELLLAARRIAEARLKGRGVIFMMGAHVVKCGLGPIIIRMMEDQLLTCVAINGAAAIHDFELACFGHTSEDVEKGLETGMFGMVKETADRINKAVTDGVKVGCGLGESVARGLRHWLPRYESISILANAHRLGIPLTMHVALGTDTVHQHPTCDGEAYGKGAMRDFRLLAAAIATLHDGGVVINCGSAVILPEVFLKALTVARNLGNPVRNFTAINMDMIQHYRPMQNVVLRPTRTGGTAITLTGHHEIMVPLLYAAVRSHLREYL